MREGFWKVIARGLDVYPICFLIKRSANRTQIQLEPHDLSGCECGCGDAVFLQLLLCGLMDKTRLTSRLTSCAPWHAG